MLMDSIVWSFKHTMRDIGEVGLAICIDLMTNFSKCEAGVANSFFRDYYVSLLQDLFFVLTSTSHKSGILDKRINVTGFKYQSLILMNMFQLVESGAITVPLYDPAQFPQNPSNPDYLTQFLSKVLATAFPHMQP
jgi:exportin-1